VFKKMPVEYSVQYGMIGILAVVATAIPTSLILISWFLEKIGLRPKNPTEVKSDPYECGMEAVGGPWHKFNFKYYMYAILFVIFDVEIIFLYPWAVKFLDLSLFALIEMFVFVGILLIGWLYAWRKNDLEWR
tara:strand:+ start:26 stop:421 length:396 start_codon:yes stop_codon:yes gene_type:complete